MKILIVDDNAEDRQLLEDIVKRKGHEAVEASDGLEGLRMAKIHRPDLIISDALMPVMDGFEFLRQIKEDETLRSMPFIFYSATYKADKDVDLAIALGADACIAKPKEPEELWEEVKIILQIREEGVVIRPELIKSDEEYLKRHGQVVAAKLEEKVRELENALVLRIKSEEKLLKSEGKLRTLVQTIPDLIWLKDAEGVYLACNKMFERLFGAKEADIIGKTDYDFVDRDLADFFREHDRKAMAAGKPNNNEEWVTFADDGHRALLDTIKTAMFDAEGKLIGVLGIARDITERRKAEESIRKLSQAIEQSPVSIVITDAAGTIEFVNTKFTQITGYTYAEAMNKNPSILKSGETPLQEYQRLWKTISSGEVWRGQFHNRKKNGELFWEQATIAPLRNEDKIITNYVAVKEDITEHKKLEEQLRQAQKMEAIGTLAGGIAHDFNNILTTISGYGYLTLMKMAVNDPLRQNIQDIMESVDRAVNLTRDLLLFSRKQPIDRKPLDLNEAIQKLGRFLVRVIGEDIEFKTILSGGPISVFADSYQLDQILMNLATNARDSMPNGGVFTIKSEVVTLNEESASSQGVGMPGTYALMTVSDTGIGMNEETLQRIFEPFFTTKEIGKGTGLGLAVVYGIVKQHDGLIKVYSEPGHGTAFRIYLPVIPTGASAEKDTVIENLPVGGMETILLAEDEKSVREMTEHILRDFGYTVITAVDGEDAVKKFADNKDSIHLLLFDLIMPRKTGKDAYDEICKAKPDVKIIFVSGYDPDVIREKALIDQNVPLLKKPAPIPALLKKIRTVLDAGKA